MTPNELRIGNWINHNNRPVFVAQILTEGLLTVYNGRGLEENATIRSIRSIPLTEELLLKCGFEPVSHFTVLNSHTISLGRGRVLSIGDTENANQMAWIVSVDFSTVTDLICIHNFDYDGKMHLHQLQNLYFALTGEELKIELL